jgi:hypothetical protein
MGVESIRRDMHKDKRDISYSKYMQKKRTDDEKYTK